MEKIIAQIAEKFIKKILENISSGKKLEEIEPILLKNCKETAVKIVEEYITVLDKEIMYALTFALPFYQRAGATVCAIAQHF